MSGRARVRLSMVGGRPSAVRPDCRQRTYNVAVAEVSDALLLAEVVLGLHDHVHAVHGEPREKEHAHRGALLSDGECVR